MRPSSGGARARTASLYTYVHTKCDDAHTHTGIPRRRLLLQVEGGREGVTAPPFHAEFTVHTPAKSRPPKKKKNRRNNNTRPCAHHWAAPATCLPSRVPHTTTAAGGQRKTNKQKRTRTVHTQQPRGRCCPATAPLLLLPQRISCHSTATRRRNGHGTHTTPPSAQYEHTQGVRFGRRACVEGRRTVGAAASMSAGPRWARRAAAAASSCAGRRWACHRPGAGAAASVGCPRAAAAGRGATPAPRARPPAPAGGPGPPGPRGTGSPPALPRDCPPQAAAAAGARLAAAVPAFVLRLWP